MLEAAAEFLLGPNQRIKLCGGRETVMNPANPWELLIKPGKRRRPRNRNYYRQTICGCLDRLVCNLEVGGSIPLVFTHLQPGLHARLLLDRRRAVPQGNDHEADAGPHAAPGAVAARGPSRRVTRSRKPQGSHIEHEPKRRDMVMDAPPDSAEGDHTVIP